MSVNLKRFIFFTLSFFFLVYSIVVFNSEPINGVGALSKEGQEGKLIFQKYNCISCHQLYGLGGYMGPDLTNVVSTEGKGVDYARAFIVSGTQRMPNFQISKAEVDLLLAYLTDVSKSGVSPLVEFETNFDGSIEIKN